MRRNDLKLFYVWTDERETDSQTTMQPERHWLIYALNAYDAELRIREQYGLDEKGVEITGVKGPIPELAGKAYEL